VRLITPVAGWPIPSIGVTMGIYSHVLSGMQEEGKGKLANRLLSKGTNGQ